MGTAITEERQLYAALNNCAFISTEGMAEDPSQPFCFLMDASMLGVGVVLLLDVFGVNASETVRKIRNRPKPSETLRKC